MSKVRSGDRISGGNVTQVPRGNKVEQVRHTTTAISTLQTEQGRKKTKLKIKKLSLLCFIFFLTCK